MKEKNIFFIGTLCILFSCSTHDDEFIKNNLENSLQKNNTTSQIVSSFEDSPLSEAVPLNEIIIEYQPGVSEIEKQTLRNQYGALSYKTCDCNNGNSKYELWTMKSGINIEPTVKVMERESRDLVRAAAQNNEYAMKMNEITTESENELDVVYIESSFNDDYLSRIVTTNKGIIIAVLDTGIDTKHVGFSGYFLYNAVSNNNCGEKSGWDFVNNHHNTYDDDPFKHGTVVSYVIHKELFRKDIDHQILPIKIADANGESTFFNTLCGLEHAIQKKSDVINLSFGWKSTDPYIYDLFSSLLNTTSATIVTSAGNEHLDNDQIPHYPSNFPQNHVLAIAAANASLSDITTYSNYGVHTVDFYAVGNKIAFPLATSNTFANFRGTSFAAPFVSAKAAELLSNNFLNVRTELRHQFGSDVQHFSKPTSYMELIKDW